MIFFAGPGDRTSCAVGGLADENQAQADSFGTRGDERLEERVAILGRRAVSRVANRNADGLVVEKTVDAYRTVGAGGLDRVQREVQRRQPKRLGVADDGLTCLAVDGQVDMSVLRMGRDELLKFRDEVLDAGREFAAQ